MIRRVGENRVKLIDFGMGTMVGVNERELVGIQIDALTDDMVTEAGAFFGTPHYSAPESFGKFKEHPFEIDVWEACSTAYALLAGRPPHIGSTQSKDHILSLLERIQNVDPPFLNENTIAPEIPWPIVNWCQHGLERETNLRMKKENLKLGWKKAVEKAGIEIKK